MNRKILLATIFPVSFFLIFLGVRNPDLNGNSDPKPRPRAILENVEKESKETCCKQQQDAEPCQIVSADLPKEVFAQIDQEMRSLVLHVAGRSSSRAPPFFTPMLS